MRAEAWPPRTRVQRLRGFTRPGGLGAIAELAAERSRDWLTAEVGPGRLMPWLPVAFGFGIVIYFAADREPSTIAALVAAILCAGGAFLARRRPVAFPLLLGAAAIAAGFTVATVKSAFLAHPILQTPAWNVFVAGWIEAKEERERTDRITVRVQRLEGSRLPELPDRVRVSVRKGSAYGIGNFVEFRARLHPPLQPLRPGGYDFARDLYFRGIGATGFALGAIRLAQPPTQPSISMRAAAAIDAMRDAIDRRIRTTIAGDAGAIASALITGKRDAISTPVNDAMYVSSLAHVLSISGYHMAVVAGVVFFVFRAGLALVPALSLRHPIKKWAALAALAGAAFYLVLSGAEIATRRAFIMIAIVLIGVMADRPALTLRTLAVAALAVMLLSPEAVVHPSFQMSFAATLALIAAYERGLPWTMAAADTSLGARVALWGGREIVALLLASLVAGLATMPYAAYHFHRLAPYGVLANLLAMPIVSAVVMPAGLLALLAIPFGFDAPLWQLMGKGIEWMITVAVWVSQLPGAVGRVAAFGTGPLLLVTAGLILVCLLKTPLRWFGCAFVAMGVLLASLTPRPDILVSGDVRAVAVRNAAGRLAVMATGGDQFAIREWLAADGDARTPSDGTLREGWRCDEFGCTARLGDGAVVALPLSVEALDEDCQRARVIVGAHRSPPKCVAKVIDRQFLRQSGALALRRTAAGFEVSAARTAGEDRPWARSAAAQPASDTVRRRPVPAMPGAEDGPDE